MNNMNVFDEIVKEHRMPVLFIGSGISRRYLYKYPNWETLLKRSFYEISKDTFLYQKYYDEFSRKGYTDFQIYKALGTAAENEYNSAFFDRKIQLDGGNQNWIYTGVSPYKMYLSKQFKRMSLYRTERIDEELEEFKKLKNKISAIITTNYDSFLETFIFPTDYTVFIHQNEMFSSNSYNIAEIYKIHGCVSDASSIVITEKDYEEFEESRKLFIAKMLTLFAESPIIFLGYSLTDENIQKIILDFLSCLSEKDKNNIHKHIIFVDYKKGERNITQEKTTFLLKNNEQIPITKIETDNFKLIFEQINRITPGVSASKIRETKRIVKRIVDKSIEQGQENALLVNIEDLDNLSDSRVLAVAVGYREDLQRTGYGSFDDIDLFEDILYDNKHFAPKLVCSIKYSSISNKRLLPVYKYAKSSINEVKENQRLISFIENRDSEDKIVTSKTIKDIQKRKEIDDYDLLISEINQSEKFSHKSALILRNINNFNCNEIRKLCSHIFDEFKRDNKGDTFYKRCVMILDYRENYLNYKERLNSQSSETKDRKSLV